MAHVQDDNINIKAKLQQSKSIKCGVNNNSAINASLQNYNAIGSNVVERGLQGIPGEAATIQLGTVTTGAPGSDVIITNSGTENAAILNFTIPRGDTGSPGTDGTSADITGVTASITNTVGVPAVTVAMGGTSLARTFDFAFSNLKGSTGATGNGISSIVKTSTSGLVDTYTITYTDGNDTTYTVTNGKDGIDGTNGTNGQDGQDGASAEITGATASVSNTVGTPSVVVTAGGTSLARSFDFAFTNLKGDKGDTGNTGATGVSVTGVTLYSTSGLDKTYRMTFSNSTYFDYVVKDGAAGATTWGGISGTLSNQTDLQNELTGLQNQIDAIVASSDVFDIVGTYAELQAYDISTVPVNDIIKVLVDSTHDDAATYYRCTESGGVKSWSYIGSEGAYYTKGETNTLLAGYEPTSTAVTHAASTEVGSATQPVYVAADGSATATTYTLNKSVPSDAKFTDTTYTFSTGLTETSGTVVVTDYNKLLKNDATGTGSIAISNNTGSSYTYDTALGIYSNASGNSVAIGYSASVGASYSIAIGNEANIVAPALTSAIQIGYGSNDTDNSLNIGFYNNSNTHYNWQLLDGSTGLIPNARLNLDTIPASGSGNAITSGAVYTALSGKEDVSNKVTTISGSSTDTQYPSAKCIYDNFGDYIATDNVYNVTIIGALANTDGLLSGFSTSNYALLPKYFPSSLSTEDWEFVIPYKTTSISGTQNVMCSDDYGIGFAINASAKLVWWISSNGTSWNIANSVTSTLTVSANTQYYFKLGRTSGTTYLAVSTDNVNFTNYISTSTSFSLQNTRFKFGISRSNADPATNGTIDLNACYIKVNGEFWWQGTSLAPSIKSFDGQWIATNTINLFTGAQSSGTTSYKSTLTSYLPNDGYAYEVMVTGYINAKNNAYTEVSILTDFASGIVFASGRNDVSRFQGNTIIVIVTANRGFSLSISNPLNDGYINLVGYRRLGTNI